MKITEINKLETSKLQEKLAELRNHSRELMFSIANNQLKAVRDLRVARKTIARILTVLNTRRHDIASADVKTNNETTK